MDKYRKSETDKKVMTEKKGEVMNWNKKKMAIWFLFCVLTFANTVGLRVSFAQQEIGSYTEEESRPVLDNLNDERENTSKRFSEIHFAQTLAEENRFKQKTLIDEKEFRIEERSFDKKNNENELKKQEDGFTKKQNQQVRIIVELEGSPIIQTAINQKKSYSQLSERTIEKRRNEIVVEQEQMISDLNDMDIEVNLQDTIQYDTAFNGVAMTVKQKDVRAIEKNPNVKNVFFSQEFQRPSLTSSKDIIGTTYAWNTLKYKGEGTVVAIIDSGIDWTHPALKLDRLDTAKYDKAAIQKIISEKKLNGKYYSLKVPYGYNYYDHNFNLFNSYGVMHGMHVAGIVGANGGMDGNLYGVAPNTQLLALKVFSDDLEYPTTFTDIWLKALDDAIALKADVVNMSLGSPAGITHEGKYHPEVEMLQRAKKAGVVVAIAAGNEGTIVDGNYYGVKPLAENYDTALVASPSSNEDSISVAAMENTKKHASLVKWTDEKGKSEYGFINLYRPSANPEVITEEVVDVYAGTEDAFRGKNFAGKIVLTEVPEKADTKEFAEVIRKITEGKPAAIILYNTEKMGSYLGGRLKFYNELANFTVGRIAHETYEKIEQQQVLQDNFKLTVSDVSEEVLNPLGGRMATFSSWGPTPDLRIKPEITAPGGNIYSTAENEKYQNMSGTSMAAPQVAGATAIVKQHLHTKGIDGEKSGEMAKLLLMNTSVPIVDMQSEGQTTPYFVRQQGAGAMNLENALRTTVVARVTGTNDNQADGKLELKQLASKSFYADIDLENFGNEPKEYYIYSTAIYEKIESGERTQKASHLLSKQDNVQEEVKVSANSKVSIRIQFDYSDADELKEGNFIEGYITLKEKTENHIGCDLNIPFLGFFGNWNKQRAIDAFAIQELNNEQKRNVQFMVNRESNSNASMFMSPQRLSIPILKNKLYFSPVSTYYRQIGLRIAPLRNMEEIEYSILDGQTKESLRVLGVSEEVHKLSRLQIKPAYRYMPDSLWDGTINGEFVEEGKEYIYQIKATLNSNGVSSETEQIYQYPVCIDNTAPEIEEETGIVLEPLSGNMKTVKFSVQDTGSGIEKVYISSLKYVTSGADNSHGTLPPGINPNPPGTKSDLESEENSEHTLSYPKDEKIEFPSEELVASKKNDQPKKKAQFGKFTNIIFVNEEMRGGKKLPKIENGKVIISPDEVSNLPGRDVGIFVNRNNYFGEKIDFEVPFFCDNSHLKVSAFDFVGNMGSKETETGIDSNFHELSFMGALYSDVEITVNGEVLNGTNFYLTGNKAEIKIKLQNDKFHIHRLYIKKLKDVTDFIKDGQLLSQAIKNYNLKYVDNTVEFTLDPVDSNYGITIAVKEGSFKQTEKEVLLDLSKVVMDDFKKLTIKNNEQATVVTTPSVIALKSGKTILEGSFKPLEGKSVSGVFLHQEDGNNIPIEKRPYFFDIAEGKRFGYNASKYNISIAVDLKQNSSLEIQYEQDNLPSGNASLETEKEISDSEEKTGDFLETENPEKNVGEEIKDVDEQTDKHNEDNHDEMDDFDINEDNIREDEDSDKEIETSDANNPKDKYPTVWIKTPKLLTVFNEENAPNATVKVDGFIGDIKVDDEIERFELQLIDKDGYAVGDIITRNKDDFQAKPIYYAEAKQIYYNAVGYPFLIDVPVKDFNTNIQVKVITKNGETGSIVRRLFYDAISPSLSYGIYERELHLDKAVIKVLAQDNSLKLNLYRNDSLIAHKNLTNLSFQNAGVQIEKEMIVPLQIGQNEIKVKALDMGKHEVEKTFYIYRSEP